MLRGFWRNLNLATKLFVTFACISLLPIAVMAVLSFEHLETIRNVSADESREFFVTLQKAHLREHLSQATKGLSQVFSKFQASARALRAPAEAVAAHSADFRYRNGSRYRADEHGGFGNPSDGNSALFNAKGSRNVALGSHAGYNIAQGDDTPGSA